MTSQPSFAAESTEPLKPAITTGDVTTDVVISIPAKEQQTQKLLFTPNKNIDVMPTNKAAGLIQVKKRGLFHHTYVYKCTYGDTMEVESKLVGIPDNRTQTEQHPIKTKVKVFAKEWSGVAQFASSAGCAIMYAAAALKNL